MRGRRRGNKSRDDDYDEQQRLTHFFRQRNAYVDAYQIKTTTTLVRNFLWSKRDLWKKKSLLSVWHCPLNWGKKRERKENVLESQSRACVRACVLVSLAAWFLQTAFFFPFCSQDKKKAIHPMVTRSCFCCFNLLEAGTFFVISS